MSEAIQLALLQHQPTPASVQVSIERLNEYAGKAAAKGASILLVPEASMTGYNIPLQSRDQVADFADGDLYQSVADIAARHSIAICYGFIEKTTDAFYNAVQLVNSQGKVVSHYRKTHLWGELDRSLFQRGDSLNPVIEIEGWQIGLLICYDVEFPETVRELALQGAELILVPTALMTPWTQVADLVVPTRAYESQLYIGYANYCGAENGIDYVGHSCIAAPDGEVLAKAAQEPKLLFATLDKEVLHQTRESLPYHKDRRPELYSRLSH